MNTYPHARTTIFGSLVVAFVLAAFPASASAKCLSNQQARKAVAAGEAVQLSAVRGKVRGEIVKARLCKNGQNYVYRITVLTKKGKVKKVRINANR